MKQHKLFFFFLTLTMGLFAQEEITEEKMRIPLISLQGATHLPGGDLADRFGMSSMTGASYHIKKANNWYYGIEVTALFGSDVKEDNIIDIITAGELDVINVNGNTSSIRFWERGAQSQVILGKILPVLSPNENSGLFIQAGLGYMYHKIRIEDIGNLSPQLNAEMRKGYDRLSMGFTTSQFIGYRHFSNNHKVNFFIGLEFIQAFTEDVRKYDYNAQSPVDDKRLDLLNGLKFGWSFPLYKKTDNRYYYY